MLLPVPPESTSSPAPPNRKSSPPPPLRVALPLNSEASSVFTPGRTYRILRVADGKVGMYDLLRAGARLDSELFPESIDRRSWPDTDEYAQFLHKRHVDYVIIFDNYDARYHTNEHELLAALVSGGGRSGYCATPKGQGEDYTVYRVGVCEPV